MFVNRALRVRSIQGLACQPRVSFSEVRMFNVRVCVLPLLVASYNCKYIICHILFSYEENVEFV